MRIRTARSQQRQGQALVEFALILPVALFLIFGIIDFGRLFIAFTSASGALRTAARYSATVGQVGTPRFMDCAGMRATAQQAFFVDNQTITIRHYRPDGDDPDNLDDLLFMNCAGLENENQLQNGDFVIIDSSNRVNLLTPFLSGIWPNIRLNFTAQRTVVKQIPLIGSADDVEPDGLNDDWERYYYMRQYGDDDITRHSATDDPDGDGCNMGCEEYYFIPPDEAGNPPFSLDPFNPDSDGDGLSDGDEIFIYGTNPQVPDTDGDGVNDGDEIAAGTDPLANEPRARNDAAVVGAFGTVDIDVLANDHVQIPSEIHIIAFDTTSLHGGTVTLNNNGTPADLTDDLLTYTPSVAFLDGLDEFTYTITDSSGVPSTATVFVQVDENGLPTPVPTAVPPDQVWPAPVPNPVLDSNGDFWRLERGSVFLGYDPWEVQWWTHNGTLENATAVIGSVTPCVTSQPFDTPLAFNWGLNPPGQCGMPADNFVVRWQRSFGLEQDVTVTFTVQADDAIQILVNGSTIVNNWVQGGGLYDNSASPVQYTFTGGVEHTIVVRYAEFSGNATVVVDMHDGTSDDRGVCGWALDASDGYPGAPAFTDFPSRNYYQASRCSLELRGAVNMNNLPNPELSFYDRWALADANDTAWLQVRRYSGGTPWYGRQVHIGPESQPSWTRQAFDLDTFQYDAIFDGGGQTNTSGTVNFTNDTIEFRFTIIGGDDDVTDSGWWVDEIRIEEGTPEIFEIPWHDNVDSGNLYWRPQGTWAISGEKTYSGAGAWSDSPGGDYMPGASNILELDGEINVTTAADPLLIFYHSWALGSGDSIYVEYTTNSGATWAPITGGALTTGTTNTAMVRQEISLNAIKGAQFGLRFRLVADHDGVQGNGWFIDDIELAERDTVPFALPFSDDANNATAENWYADGTWALSPEAYHGPAGSAWSDSPGGNYLHQSSSSLRSQKVFDISSLTQPELSFWHRRDLAANDGLHVDVSTDYGATWTTIWSREYCASGSTTETAPDSNGNPVSCTLFNQQLGWERISIDMGAHTGAPFYLRFRMDAMSDSAVAGGAWIDDIRLANYTETPHTIQPTRFFDGMEDAGNWYLGGSWDTTLADSYAGAASMTDSPNTSYTTGTWSVLQLRQPISLAGITAAQNPTLSWWDRYALEQYDYARVQVSAWVGPAWSDWTGWQEVAQHYMDTNTAWNRHSVDLSEYAGQKIRLRFVLDALNLPDVADGWYIDNVAVELSSPTIHSVPYSEDANSLTGWFPGGTWTTNLGMGIGTIDLGAGSWNAYFHDLEDADCTGYAQGPARATAAITGQCDAAYASNPVALGAVNFACAAGQTPDPTTGACSATPWKSDYLAIRFVRTFNVTEAGQFSFDVTHNDGAQLYVYPASGSRGAPVLDRWLEVSGTITPSATVDMDLAAGSYIIELWYFETTGNSSITLGITRPDMAFYARTTGAYDDMLLTLDGLIDLNGITTPSMSWAEQYSLTSNESCIAIEMALPYYRTDRWVSAFEPVCGPADSAGWQLRSIPNLRTRLQTLESAAYGPLTISGNNARMALRFRLYADAPDNEWFVDNIVISGP